MKKDGSNGSKRRCALFQWFCVSPAAREGKKRGLTGLQREASDAAKPLEPNSMMISLISC